MTHAARRLFGFVFAIAIIASPALAQDDPRFALLTSFPSPTVSFQWELSERFALRVDGSYSYRDEVTDAPIGGGSFGGSGFRETYVIERHLESRTHGGSIGIAGIFTFHRAEPIRLYIAPRVSLGFSRQRINVTETMVTTSEGVPPGVSVIFGSSPSPPETIRVSSTSPTAGASFGAVTNVHRRLALFGEAGFTYARSDSPPIGAIATTSSIDDYESKRTTVNTRAVGGVMILF